MDVFQALKDEDRNNDSQDETFTKPPSESSEQGDVKVESQQDSDEPGTSEKGVKRKAEKQNRKELEEEEREKML